MCYLAPQPIAVTFKETGKTVTYDNLPQTLLNLVKNGDVAQIEAILANVNGYNVNSNLFGNTMLNVAVRNCDEMMTSWLIEKGANSHYTIGSPRLSIYTPSAYKVAQTINCTNKNSIIEILESSPLHHNDYIEVAGDEPVQAW